MSYCGSNAKTPSISVTLKDYKTGCQCVPAPKPTPLPPSPKPENSADQLTTPRKISLSGAASGYAYFDGSSDVDIPVTIPSISNIELGELLRGDAETGSVAFLDNNGILFLWERIKALVEEEAGSTLDPGGLTEEQINKLFSSVEIINGGDANGTT